VLDDDSEPMTPVLVLSFSGELVCVELGSTTGMFVGFPLSIRVDETEVGEAVPLRFDALAGCPVSVLTTDVGPFDWFKATGLPTGESATGEAVRSPEAISKGLFMLDTGELVRSSESRGLLDGLKIGSLVSNTSLLSVLVVAPPTDSNEVEDSCFLP